jgi:hypothetical protein
VYGKKFNRVSLPCFFYHIIPLQKTWSMDILLAKHEPVPGISSVGMSSMGMLNKLHHFPAPQSGLDKMGNITTTKNKELLVPIKI